MSTKELLIQAKVRTWASSGRAMRIRVDRRLIAEKSPRPQELVQIPSGAGKPASASPRATRRSATSTSLSNSTTWAHRRPPDAPSDVPRAARRRYAPNTRDRSLEELLIWPEGTISVEHTAAVVPCGRTWLYQALQSGEWPTRVVKTGRTYRIVLRGPDGLLALLGIGMEAADAAPPGDDASTGAA